MRAAGFIQWKCLLLFFVLCGATLYGEAGLERPAYTPHLHMVSRGLDCSHLLGLHHTDVVWERELPQALFELLEGTRLVISDTDLISNFHAVKSAVEFPLEPQQGQRLSQLLSPIAWERFVKLMRRSFRSVDGSLLDHLHPAIALTLHQTAYQLPFAKPTFDEALWAALGNVEAYVARRAARGTRFEILSPPARSTVSPEPTVALRRVLRTTHDSMARLLEFTLSNRLKPRHTLAALFRHSTERHYEETLRRFQPALQSRIRLTNARWAEELAPLLANSPALVLVDVLHLYGSTGLLKHLKDRGFFITTLP